MSGSLVVRYGLSPFNPPGEIIVPGLFASEKGGVLVGREAWDYLQNNFQVHPRADVVGVRLNGEQVQAYVRELDFGVPTHVLIYEDEQVSHPVCEATGLVVSADAPPLPDLLGENLPLITDLEAFIEP